jgi:uracil-DNA glycosylase/DNA polymerase I-like protein with 3'-5' exonuclease and polymerase domains
VLVRPDGPTPARIMLLGEAPGEREEQRGVPFVGPSGEELNRMLGEVGLMRSECYCTNVVKIRPPNNWLGAFIAQNKKSITPMHKQLRDKWVLPPVIEGFEMLKQEIKDVQPAVIVAYGNLALWALTGAWGITKWRGSYLRPDQAFDGSEAWVMPTYHPAAILRQWDWRASSINDLRRAARIARGQPPLQPKWNFCVRPNFTQVIDRLQWLWRGLEARQLDWLDLDLETRAGHIACCGISWTKTDALIIPLMCVEQREGYWNQDEEAAIVYWLWRVLCHPAARVRLQNGLYDAQYIWRFWHFVPRVAQDTMISQHAIWADQPKKLSYQASMYCDWYVYWKDEGKTWSKTLSEDSLWYYNGEDCVYTRECGEVELQTVQAFGASVWPGLPAVHEFQQELFWPVLKAMQRGIRVDFAARGVLAMELQEHIAAREQWFIDILGHPLNPQSSDQMHKLFYEDFIALVGRPILKRVKNEATGLWEMRPTLDDDALTQLATREPLLKPLCNAIQDHRTLNVLLSTFVMAKLDIDGRMRCSFNIGGSESGESAPYTYRLSSNKNAFDGGANLQNIPSEKSKSMGKAAKRGSMGFDLPNVRTLYIADPGFTFFDMDLDRADLQTVVWESEEPDFKKAMQMGVDLHLWNAYILQGKEPPALDELIEGHARYPDHRGRMKYAREFAKVFCHGTNYGGGAATMAKHCGVTTHEADRAQRIWFGAHPGIQRWHRRTEDMLFNRAEFAQRKSTYLENRFGYRWYIFDRVAGLLPDALAWLPQSHTSCVINRIWMNFHKQLPAVETLLQVHDSLAGQFPTHLREQLVPRMRELSRIPIPYPDPLIIPTGLKLSEKSWGDCA